MNIIRPLKNLDANREADHIQTERLSSIPPKTVNLTNSEGISRDVLPALRGLAADSLHERETHTVRPVTSGAREPCDLPEGILTR